METKTLYVAGTFDDNDGKSSSIADQIFHGLDFQRVNYVNGGNYGELEQLLGTVGDYDVVFWLADVANDKPKLVKRVKAVNRECVLVSSKRNVDQKYTVRDLLYHALDVKSNVFVEFTKQGELYAGRVMDPLANVFLDTTTNFGNVGEVLSRRVHELMGYTRVPSEKVGMQVEVPDEREFFEQVRRYAEVFHELINPSSEAANRFFGNASFRCERGFPSFKKEGLVFVSMRNVDKRYIGRDGFVGVKQGLPVRYFGDHKPSVDTPVQLRLYENYPAAKYMLHSHTYVSGAPFTAKVLPCGALQEVDEITSVVPGGVNFAVNLKGHGSLAVADNVGFFETLKYYARTFPEINEYACN